MRLRHITGSEDFVADSPYVVHRSERYRGVWNRELFPKPQPIHLEIGMGKGQFITQLAVLHPERNYVGIERYDTVLMKALRKRESAEAAGCRLENLRYLSLDARLLPEHFAENEVSKLYLNFSDPWPKARQANRRLTSQVFLDCYTKFLRKDGTLEFKTDNTGLFDYSLENIPAAGWTLLAVSRDLHRDPVLNEGNVMTEYEEKFSAKGHPICKLIAAPPAGL